MLLVALLFPTAAIRADEAPDPWFAPLLNTSELPQNLQDTLKDLGKQMGASDFKTRSDADAALRKIGMASFPVLAAALSSKDLEISSRAHSALGELLPYRFDYLLFDKDRGLKAAGWGFCARGQHVDQLLFGSLPFSWRVSVPHADEQWINLEIALKGEKGSPESMSGFSITPGNVFPLFPSPEPDGARWGLTYDSCGPEHAPPFLFLVRTSPATATDWLSVLKGPPRDPSGAAKASIEPFKENIRKSLKPSHLKSRSLDWSRAAAFLEDELVLKDLLAHPDWQSEDYFKILEPWKTPCSVDRSLQALDLAEKPDGPPGYLIPMKVSALKNLLNLGSPDRKKILALQKHLHDETPIMQVNGREQRFGDLVLLMLLKLTDQDASAFLLDAPDDRLGLGMQGWGIFELNATFKSEDDRRAGRSRWKTWWETHQSEFQEPRR